MNKKIFVGIAVLVILGIAAGAFFLLRGSGLVATIDSIRFKEEYESRNSEMNEDGTHAYTRLSIDKKNSVVYLTFEELVDFIENKTGLLYFGRSGCPWCRLLVPYMLDFAREDKVSVYYYDIERDREENNDNYKKLLSMLGDHLPTDTVTQSEDDPDFDPDLKRVVLPQLFFIKNGAIKAEAMLYQHDYLKNGEAEKVKQLLRDKYDAIVSSDCGVC